MRSNEENLDLFADLMEPVAEILTDPEVTEKVKGGGKPIQAVKAAIKGHHDAVITILALLEGVEVEDYTVPPPAALLVKIMNLVNDPMVQEVFTLQGLPDTAASGGSATETTQAKDKDGV